MMLIRRFFPAFFLLIVSTYGHTSHIDMVRVKQGFPETMLKLQEVIKEHGYKLSRVQRVDIGLTKSGYKTDKYRVVFFSKHKEFRWVIDNHPELIPYLPLKIAIYAEGNDTILVVYNPRVLFQPTSKKLEEIVLRWEKDLQSIFNVMHKFDEE